MKTKTVHILGQKYQVITGVDFNKDEGLRHVFGYVEHYGNRIVIGDLNTLDDWKDEREECKMQLYKETVRHEVVHAFLFQSGLAGSSNTSNAWAMNEEMVDWIAVQLPKIVEVCTELCVM